MTTDPTSPEGRAELRELLAKGTPGPWQADDCEGELRVGAGDAVTAWQERTDEEGRSYRVGTPPWTWKSTNLIYEHDLETWDEGEDQDDDQRRIDAELIVAARNALPALLDALDDAELRAENERLLDMLNRANAAEAALARVRKVADRYAAARPQWDRLPYISDDLAEGMNTAGEAILRALDGDQ